MEPKQTTFEKGKEPSNEEAKRRGYQVLVRVVERLLALQSIPSSRIGRRRSIRLRAQKELSESSRR
jgi:hypothetical protein